MAFSVADYRYLVVYLQHIFYFYCILSTNYESVDTIFTSFSFIDFTDRKYVVNALANVILSTSSQLYMHRYYTLC